jgi:NADH-quinone oxidoreductase subunit N
MNALYVVCGLGVISLMAEIVNLRKQLLVLLITGLAAAMILVLRDWNTTQSYFSNMLVFDSVSLAFTGIIALLIFFWFWMSRDYFKNETHITDQAALILFCGTGAIVLTSFNSLVMLFLGIEILSIPLYVLAGSSKNSFRSNEASFKYFLMGSFASAFLLMGIALVYGATQTFYIDQIAERLTDTASLPSFLYLGIFLMFVGMAFKISAVPFHFWAPDVYEGAPTSITAFMSTVVKVAAFAAFVRLFNQTFAGTQSSWIFVVQIITMLTLVVANITAVYQNNVKRMLAYSSVGHAGYILLAFVAGSGAEPVIIYYLAVYAISSLISFGIVSLVESQRDGELDSFKNLYHTNPLLAVVFTLALLSLAGIPPLAGFIGKYQVFALALSQGQLVLVLLAVATSLIGVFYYFKVIIAMFGPGTTKEELVVSSSAKTLLLVLSVIVLVLGVLPDLIMAYIR